MKNLPALHQHDLRRALHNEVHSRPPEDVANDTAVFCTVMWADEAERAASSQWLHRLLRDLQMPVPDAEATHLRLDLGSCKLRWELHTEFVSWTWVVPISADALDDAELPVASDAELLPLLDQQKVDYVLMSTTTLEQSLQKGFSDRYQVVFSGSDLRVPIAMATQLQDPILNAKGDSLRRRWEGNFAGASAPLVLNVLLDHLQRCSAARARKVRA